MKTWLSRRAGLPLMFLSLGLAVALGAGTPPKAPTFADRYDYGSLDPSYSSIATADVNNDGIPDLILNLYNGVGTLLGNGDGTLRYGPTSDVGYYGGQAVIPADLNGDGKIDIITRGDAGSAGPVGIVVSFGNGDGTFQPGTFYQAGSNSFCNYLVSGDFNGDSFLDIVAGTESGAYLFTGLGGGLFNPGVLITFGQSEIEGENQVVVADVNGDGKLDLLAEISNAIAIRLGNGDGSFGALINIPVPFLGLAFTIGDFNNDGHVDLFCLQRFKGVGLLYLGNGDGTFRLTREVNIGGVPDTVVAADLNGDGFLDLATGNGNVLYGDGQGHFSSPVNYSTIGGGNSEEVLPVDLRKNGRLDLVFGGYLSGLSVLLNNGKGRFQDGQTSPLSGGAAYCAVAADFNHDGIPDLALGVDQGISILLGTGKAASPYTQGPLLTYPVYSCPVTGDLNGDGIPDLLATTNSNTAIAFLGSGDGTFTQVARSTQLSANGILAVGDFNGDGKLDFALSSNLLAYGNGDGTFRKPQPFIPQMLGSNIGAIASGQLHGIKLNDIVLADAAANLVYVLLSNGHGFTQTTFNTPAECTGPSNLTLTDLDLNGTKDLLVGCSGSTIEVYRNDGLGAFQYVSGVNGGGPDFARAIAADVNGDGIPDLITQGDNADLTILPGLGNLTYSTSGVNIGAGAAPGPVLALDAHGQKLFVGRADLITPDYNGYVNIFFNTTK